MCLVNCAIIILNNEIVRVDFDHNQEKLSDVIIKSKIAQYEEKILTQTTRQPLSQIHTEVQSKLVQELTEGQLEEETERILDEVSEAFPDFDAVRSGLAKRRKKNQVPLPQAIDEIELDDESTKTNSGQKFLLYDNKKKKKSRIMIFC